MKLIKNIVLITFFFLLMTTIEGCAPRGVKYVYAIEKTRTFHRADCAPVHMANAIKMTLNEAVSEHLRPCPICRPDRE